MFHVYQFACEHGTEVGTDMGHPGSECKPTPCTTTVLESVHVVQRAAKDRLSFDRVVDVWKQGQSFVVAPRRPVTNQHDHQQPGLKLDLD